MTSKWCKAWIKIFNGVSEFSEDTLILYWECKESCHFVGLYIRLRIPVM